MTQGWTGRPCPRCGGAGAIENGDGLLVGCESCAGTGEEYGDLPDADAPPAIKEPDEWR